METKTLKILFIKTLFLITGITFGFAGSYKCDAQSIVGKWNQKSAKQFLTEEGARTHGKPVLETQMSTIGSVVFEFKSDHTYIEKTTHARDSKVLTFTGTWSVPGNQLKLKMDPEQEDPKYNPKKDAVSPDINLSINGNEMVWITFYPDSKLTAKTELTFTRF